MTNRFAIGRVVHDVWLPQNLRDQWQQRRRQIEPPPISGRDDQERRPKHAKLSVHDDAAGLIWMGLYLTDSAHWVLSNAALNRAPLAWVRASLEAAASGASSANPPDVDYDPATDTEWIRQKIWLPPELSAQWRSRSKELQISLEEDLAGLVFFGLWLPDPVHWELAKAATGEKPVSPRSAAYLKRLSEIVVPLETGQRGPAPGPSRRSQPPGRASRGKGGT